MQLFGHEPEIIADTAKRLSEELNADSAFSGNQKQIAVFDINMGCPAPKITGNGDGSALMRSPALAARIIEAAVRAVSIPVSVKLRLGWDADSINAVEFAKMAESSGAAFVTVHGRTRMQMYSGTADWDKIAEVVNAVRIPVIGNGDVFSGTDAAALAAKTGCAGIMAARGAQGNPFLLRKSAPHCAEKITFPLPPAQGLTPRFGIFRNTLPLTGTAHLPICASILHGTQRACTAAPSCAAA